MCHLLLHRLQQFICWLRVTLFQVEHFSLRMWISLFKRRIAIFCECSLLSLHLVMYSRDKRNFTQSQLFERSPAEFYASVLSNRSWTLPDIALTFDAYVDELAPIFEKLDLIQVRGDLLLESDICQIANFRHAHFRYDYDDPRIKKYVVVFRRRCCDSAS